jgi:hypothetical protein
MSSGLIREPRPHVFDNSHVYADDMRAIGDDYDDSRKKTSLSVLSQTGVGADNLTDTALKVTQSSTPGRVDVGAGSAIDSNGELIYVPENILSGDSSIPDFPARLAISVPTSGVYSDGVTYYVKIAYSEIPYEYETDAATQTSHPTRYLRSYAITVDTSPAVDPKILLATVIGGDGGTTMSIADCRTLLSGRVTAITDDSVASDAGIGQEKIDNTDVQDDAYGGTPTNLAHDLNQVRTVIRNHKGATSWTGYVHSYYQHTASDVYVIDASGSFGGRHTVEGCLEYLGQSGGGGVSGTGTVLLPLGDALAEYNTAPLSGGTAPTLVVNDSGISGVCTYWTTSNDDENHAIWWEFYLPDDYQWGTDLTLEILGWGAATLNLKAYVHQFGDAEGGSPRPLGGTLLVSTTFPFSGYLGESKMTIGTFTIPGLSLGPSLGMSLSIKLWPTSITTGGGSYANELWLLGARVNYQR